MPCFGPGNALQEVGRQIQGSQFDAPVHGNFAEHGHQQGRDIPAEINVG